MVTDWIRRGIFSAIFLFYCGFWTWEYFNYEEKPTTIETAKDKWKKVNFQPEDYQTGDLVVRRGKGFVSDAMLGFSKKDPSYSHSGILKKEKGRVFVYHSIGGESRETNEMLKEPVEIFCHPNAAFDFAFYRYTIPDTQMQIFDSVLTAYYESGMEFDLDFDMSTDETMYCSEMIYKAFDVATNGKNFIPLAEVSDKPYVAIDDLYLNDHCKLLFEYHYD